MDATKQRSLFARHHGEIMALHAKFTGYDLLMKIHIFMLLYESLIEYETSI